MIKSIPIAQTKGLGPPFFGYIWAMFVTILFTLAFLLIFFRIFQLRLRANNAKTESFQRLPAKDKMAVLKECLLNNPTEGNLQNLKEFCDKEGLQFDADGYRPFIKEQLELARVNANYVECDKLYVRECEFIDRTAPMEFAEAEAARNAGDAEQALALSLEGVSRLYSDGAIEKALTDLEPSYPKAAELREKYIALAEACNASGADEKSLEILRKQKEDWLADLLTLEK